MTGPERDRLAPLRALLLTWTEATCQTDGAPCSWHRVSAECAAEATVAIAEVEALLDPTPAEPEGDDVEALARVMLSERLAARGLPASLVDDDEWLETVRPRARHVLAAGYRRTPAPVPPEQLREQMRDVLSGWPIGDGYCSTKLDFETAGEMADAVLAVLPQTTLTPAPEGETVTEYGLIDPAGVTYTGEDEGLRWDRDEVNMARNHSDDETPADTIVSRPITTYPTVVGEWEPVGDADE